MGLRCSSVDMGRVGGRGRRSGSAGQIHKGRLVKPRTRHPAVATAVTAVATAVTSVATAVNAVATVVWGPQSYYIFPSVKNHRRCFPLKVLVLCSVSSEIHLASLKACECFNGCVTSFCFI
jgi:hypothetical protein